MHSSSKNARYSDVLDYYKYKHEEDQTTGHYEPVLDEYGLKQERENCQFAYINAHGEEDIPEKWEAACMKTNLQFRKNLQENDRKSHEYIISHPAEDREKMTDEDLMNEGKAFCRDNLKGYDCLIAVHRDTDHDHIHISFNSVRAVERPEEEWMMKKDGQTLNCEMAAGGKHQDSPQFKRYRNEWLLNYCQEHGLTEKDNNAIADQRREERHGSKNEQMKNALLDAASRSKDMKDLQRIMKQEYDMDIKKRGETISVLYPGNEKYVRLRTLGLQPSDLTRKMQGEQYTFTAEAKEQHIQKKQEAEEQKKYIDWIRERRNRNNDRAETSISEAQELISEKLRQRGERYDKTDFQDLNHLIRQTAYMSAALQTEKDKIDNLMERWEQYKDPSLSDQERKRHGGYVKWCGCDPTSDLEFNSLKTQKEIIENQLEQSNAMKEALSNTADQWKGHNEINYAENDLQWKKIREKQLKQQLKYTKENTAKLWEISCNCERSALKRSGVSRSQAAARNWNVQGWDNYAKFRSMWVEKVEKQKEIEKQLKVIRQQKREAKKNVRNIKKNVKERGM